LVPQHLASRRTFIPLLNMPSNNMYSPMFVQALAKAEEAKRAAGQGIDPVGVGQLRDAVRLLAESNALLIHVLTDGNVK
jgi:hypothetical protein